MANVDNTSVSTYSKGMPKKNRNKVGLDIPKEIQEQIDRIAKQLGVPKSQVYALFVAEGIISFNNEESSIWDRLRKSSSRRYKHNIDIDDLIDKFNKKG